MTPAKERERSASIIAVAAILVAALVATATARADVFGAGSSFTGVVGASGITFLGAATDITTGVNEDLTLDANGTGKTICNDTFNVTGGLTVIPSGANTALIKSLAFNGALRVGANAGVGSNADEAIGTIVGYFGDNMSAGAGGNALFSVDGVGIVKMVAGVTASNNLAGTSACAASGDVGKDILYSDTSTSKITRCICEQTGAGTFAWGAATAAGDCT